MAENNISLFLRALLGQAQVLENAMVQVYGERGVDNAVGAQLDVLGNIVGESRGGLGDDNYRRHIRARILTNRSTGIISNMLAIADLIVYDAAATYELQNQGAAAYVLYVRDIALGIATLKILARFLRDATAAGVRMITQANASLAVDAFNFSDGPGKGFAALPLLDLAPLTANVDTKIHHRDSRSGTQPTLALTADGTGSGSLTNTGDVWVFHFESSVTTVAQFETAINASSGLVVAVVDGVGTMGAGDVLAATMFTRANTGGKLACVLE